MISCHITIVNKRGLHARAAALFVTLAASFNSKILLKQGDRALNGKSILGIMTLAAAKGSTLELVIDGADEQVALEKLSSLVARGFDEKD